jgi:hypothetical protein
MHLQFELALSLSLALVGCSGSADRTGTNQPFDEATADPCNKGVVSHLTRSRTPFDSEPEEMDAGPSSNRDDAGGLPGLRPDPCRHARPMDCPGTPRAIFGCPSVSTPNAGGDVHRGDQITVTVPITDEGLAAYSCFGLLDDRGLTRVSVLLYAVKPGYVEESGRVLDSNPPGAAIHFSAEATGTRQEACAGDLTRVEFDVIVK